MVWSANQFGPRHRINGTMPDVPQHHASLFRRLTCAVQPGCRLERLALRFTNLCHQLWVSAVTVKCCEATVLENV